MLFGERINVYRESEITLCRKMHISLVLITGDIRVSKRLLKII